MNDIQLAQDSFTIDFVQGDGNLVTSQDLENAVLISLFTDKRVDQPVDGEQGGWWGDVSPFIENDFYGSKLWTLRREKATQETVNRAIEIVKEALNWLVEDGIAQKIEVNAEIRNREWLAIEIHIFRPTSSELFKFEYAWEAQKIRRGV